LKGWCIKRRTIIFTIILLWGLIRITLKMYILIIYQQ
jgi:hypothetical protein